MVVKWTLRTVGALLAVLLLTAAAAYVWRLPLAVTLAHHLAKSQGLGDLDLRLTRLEPSLLEATEIALNGDALKVSRVLVTYHWRDLWQGRVAEIVIEGPQLTLSLRDDGLDWGPLAPLMRSPESHQESAAPRSSLDPIPFDRLGVSDLQLTLRGPQLPEQAVTLTGEADLAAPGTGRFNLASRVHGAAVQLGGHFALPTTADAPWIGDLSGQLSGLELPPWTGPISLNVGGSFIFNDNRLTISSHNLLEIKTDRLGTAASDVVPPFLRPALSHGLTLALSGVAGAPLGLALEWPAGILTSNPWALSVTAPTDPIRSVLRLEGTSASASLPDGRVTVGPFRLSMDAGPGQRIAASGKHLAVSLPANRVAVTLDGGEVALPNLGQATDINLSYHGASFREGQVSLTVDQLRPPPPSPVVPLSLALNGTWAEQRITAQGEVHDATRDLMVQVTAHHHVATNSGQAMANVLPLVFTPGGLQPASLAPILNGLLPPLGGHVAAKIAVNWTPKGVRHGGEVALSHLGLTLDNVSVEDLNGVLTLDRLWPLRSKGMQEISVGRILAGLPFDRGLIRLKLDPGWKLTVAETRFQLLGGQVSTQPFTVTLDTLRGRIVGEAAGLSLEALARLANLDDVSAEGRLSGAIPLALADGELTLEAARLYAEQPGVLRYRPSDPPAALAASGQAARLMLQALQDFHYTTLEVTVDGTLGKMLTAGLSLKGANPQTLEGYPFEINLNLEGPLDRIVQDSLQGYRVPETISRKLQEFGLSDLPPSK